MPEIYQSTTTGRSNIPDSVPVSALHQYFADEKNIQTSIAN
jgi:hypothetical protein